MGTIVKNHREEVENNMSDYGFSSSNSEDKNTKFPRRSRREVSKLIIYGIANEEKRKNEIESALKQSYYYEYVKQGIETRFNKEVAIDMTNLDEDQRKAYLKGYYEEGNRLLALAILSNKIPERVMKILGDKNITLEAFIQYTGYYDGKDSNIVFEQLPETIQSSSIYQNGYNLGYFEQKGARGKQKWETQKNI